MTQPIRSLNVSNLINNLTKFGIGMESMLDQFDRTTARNSVSYPPHNVLKTGPNNIVIEMAVAGFAKDDITVEVNDSVLCISGVSATTKYQNDGQDLYETEYVYQGISNRSFKREFALGEYMEVTNASHVNGILSIWVERKVPEEKKARKIDIM